MAASLNWILRSLAPHSRDFACGFWASPICTRISTLTTIIGIARTSRSVLRARRLWSRRRRRDAPNSLLFDDGDIFQGTPLGDLAAEAIIADPTAVHPVIAAMNTLDYAVATLGNHDFNYGLEAPGRGYAQARFPVVCCNVRKSDGSPWFPPSIVIERGFVDELGTATSLRLA